MECKHRFGKQSDVAECFKLSGLKFGLVESQSMDRSQLTAKLNTLKSILNHLGLYRATFEFPHSYFVIQYYENSMNRYELYQWRSFLYSLIILKIFQISFFIPCSLFFRIDTGDVHAIHSGMVKYTTRKPSITAPADRGCQVIERDQLGL